jgi:hypothetical protein
MFNHVSNAPFLLLNCMNVLCLATITQINHVWDSDATPSGLRALSSANRIFESVALYAAVNVS